MKNYREERIERLLYELEYEISRGMMEREINETITHEFYVPFSHTIPKGVVKCAFQTRPVPTYMMPGMPPKLQLVKK
jgi:hypothetical protein